MSSRCFSSRQASKPVLRGMITSMRIRSGRSAAATSTACCPSWAVTSVVGALLQDGHHHEEGGLGVVDDEDLLLVRSPSTMRMDRGLRRASRPPPVFATALPRRSRRSKALDLDGIWATKGSGRRSRRLIRVSRTPSGKPEGRELGARPRAAHGDAVLLDALVEGAAREAEHFGGLGHGAALGAEHALDVPALGVGQAQAAGRGAASAAGPRRARRATSVGAQDGAVAQQHRALEDVAELAHVAGPGMAARACSVSPAKASLPAGPSPRRCAPRAAARAGPRPRPARAAAASRWACALMR